MLILSGEKSQDPFSNSFSRPGKGAENRQYSPDLDSAHLLNSLLMLTPALTELDIRIKAVSFESLWSLPFLTSLRLHCTITDASMLASFVQNCKYLTELEISTPRGSQNMTKLTNKVAEVLKGRSNTLKRLKLCNLQIKTFALAEYFASSASKDLECLALLDLAEVQSKDLVAAQRLCEDCFFTSTTPLSLEIDERLFSLPLIKEVGQRLYRLRLLGATNLLGSMIELGYLPNLSLVIVIPSLENDAEWYEQGQLRLQLHRITSSHLPALDLRFGDDRWVEEREERRREKETSREAVASRDLWPLIASVGGAAFDFDDDW